MATKLHESASVIHRINHDKRNNEIKKTTKAPGVKRGTSMSNSTTKSPPRSVAKTRKSMDNADNRTVEDRLSKKTTGKPGMKKSASSSQVPDVFKRLSSVEKIDPLLNKPLQNTTLGSKSSERNPKDASLVRKKLVKKSKSISAIKDKHVDDEAKIAKELNVNEKSSISGTSDSHQRSPALSTSLTSMSDSTSSILSETSMILSTQSLSSNKSDSKNINKPPKSSPHKSTSRSQSFNTGKVRAKSKSPKKNSPKSSSMNDIQKNIIIDDNLSKTKSNTELSYLKTNDGCNLMMGRNSDNIDQGNLCTLNKPSHVSNGSSLNSVNSSSSSDIRTDKGNVTDTDTSQLKTNRVKNVNAFTYDNSNFTSSMEKISQIMSDIGLRKTTIKNSDDADKDICESDNLEDKEFYKIKLNTRLVSYNNSTLRLRNISKVEENEENENCDTNSSSTAEDSDIKNDESHCNTINSSGAVKDNEGASVGLFRSNSVKGRLSMMMTKGKNMLTDVYNARNGYLPDVKKMQNRISSLGSNAINYRIKTRDEMNDKDKSSTFGDVEDTISVCTDTDSGIYSLMSTSEILSNADSQDAISYQRSVIDGCSSMTSSMTSSISSYPQVMADQVSSIDEECAILYNNPLDVGYQTTEFDDKYRLTNIMSVDSTSISTLCDEEPDSLQSVNSIVLNTKENEHKQDYDPEQLVKMFRPCKCSCNKDQKLRTKHASYLPHLPTINECVDVSAEENSYPYTEQLLFKNANESEHQCPDLINTGGCSVCTTPPISGTDSRDASSDALLETTDAEQDKQSQIVDHVDNCSCKCHTDGILDECQLPQDIQDILDADRARMWWTITGNFGNILPIDWSKTYTRQQYLPVLNLNQQSGINGNGSSPGNGNEGTDGDEEDVAQDLDLHQLIVAGLSPDPVKSADEVIQEIDDIMQEGSSSEDEAIEESTATSATSISGDSVTKALPPPMYQEKLQGLGISELNEVLMELELVIRQYSETLISQLALRDELEYEKELKNTFISLLLQVQNKRRNYNVEKKKQKKITGPNGTDPKYLTTVIPYDVGHGPPDNHTLQVLIKILTAINEDTPTVPTLLTDYILKGPFFKIY